MTSFRFFRWHVKRRHDIKSALKRFPHKHCVVQPSPTYRCIENPAHRRGFIFPALCFADEA